MFDVGFSELVLLFVIGLLILGPERLPKVASQIGRWEIRRDVLVRVVDHDRKLGRSPPLFDRPTLGSVRSHIRDVTLTVLSGDDTKDSHRSVNLERRHPAPEGKPGERSFEDQATASAGRCTAHRIFSSMDATA